MLRDARLVLLALVPLAAAASAQVPRHVYLTWQGDTATTMTVVYHTFGAAPGPSVVRYGPDGEGALGLEARGASHPIPDLAEDRWVHVVELVDLEPGARVRFTAGAPGAESAERAFRTVPDDGRPVRFVTGGDLGVSDEVLRLHRHAAGYEPQFALVGGDVAYVDGDLDAVARWDAWFDQWAHMVTPSGLTVPLVLAVGNHEVQGGYLGGLEGAPFFFGFFPQTPRDAPRSFFRRAFGSHVAVYVLDTGHVVEHGGAQAAWLDEQLAADAGVAHRFALYHVPLYPSHRATDGGGSVRGRAAWGEIFDRHGLTAAFENHDHTFKRTHPLRGDSVDADGVLYLGDGAWGRGDRPVDLSRRWYHAKAGSLRHVWVVDAAADGVTYRAFDLDGRLLDVVPGGTPEADSADAYFATREQSYALRDGSISVTPIRTRAAATAQERLTVEVHNREDYPMEGVVAVDAGDGLRAEPVRQALSLRPGARRALAFTLSTDEPVAPEAFPRAVLDVDLSFAAPDGVARYRSRRPVAVEPELRAERAATTVDGDLSEWGALPFTMGRPVEGRLVGDPGRDALSLWGGPTDASLAFGVRHDDGGVTLAVRVEDDALSVGGPGVWDAALEGPRHDALVVWADPHPGGEGDDDPAFVVDPSAPAGPVLVVDGDFEAAAAAVRVASAPTPTGYAVEVRLPWSFFEGRSDEPLQAVRLNLALADRDDADESARVFYWRPAWESEGDYPWSGVVDVQR